MRSKPSNRRAAGIATALLSAFALDLIASPVDAVQYIPQNGQYVPQQQRYQQPNSSAAYANCANALLLARWRERPSGVGMATPVRAPDGVRPPALWLAACAAEDENANKKMPRTPISKRSNSACNIARGRLRQ